MKNVRIVIVSWNVEQLLARCLRSLPGACSGLEWDCVVVDNASKDGSIAVATGIPNIHVIANQNNRGFAKACNQGLVGSDARYVLLLNPDTECPPGSLASLVREADVRPTCGIAGPRLVDGYGADQASVRRFPTVWDQAGIMLKLHHVVPALFRRYFANDWPIDRAASVDQVMGSCFLIRRDVVEQIGGLDERYFIWFEEVDYCKQAKEHGWDVCYVPTVRITHHGGQSFCQVFSVKKQRYFNDSLVKYFKKWQPGWRAALLAVLRPLSLALASASSLSPWAIWAGVVFLIEVVSLATIFHPKANSAATIFVALVVGLLAWKRPTLALAALLMELMIGSKGYLLQLGAWPDAISLRIVLFAVFMAGWALNVTQTKSWSRLTLLFRGRVEWLLLFIVVGYATLRGMALGNQYVAVDGNAWGFLLLIIPVLDIASRMSERLRRDVLPVLFVAPVWLAVKTIGLEYLFSHGFSTIADPVYLWVRRTGVGEVTYITGNAFRIFMQSYIFALPVLFFCASKYFATHEKGDSAGNREPGTGNRFLHRVTDLLAIAALVVLGISLSRSMWIGAAAGMVTLLMLVLSGLPVPRLSLGTSPVHEIFKGIGRLIVVGIFAALVIVATLAFPIPRVDVASLATLFGSRVSTEDAAAASRWKLLPVVLDKIMERPFLGSGFGATVTYQTSDPRIVSQTGGMYTTYALEWGWLEHWVKFGVFGFALMIVLVWRVGRRVARLAEPRWIVAAGVATVVGLAVTHVFTPYLNHPLGFGVLFVLEGLVQTSRCNLD